MATRIVAFAFVGVLLAAPTAALAQRLQLDALDRLAARASESVNIDLDPAMLQFALPFLKGDANEQEVKALISQLKGIYVRVFEFSENVDTSGEMSAIRKQLTTPWTRLLSVDTKNDRALVEIYTWRQGDASGGLAILAAEGNELTVVNIVGAIDLAKLPMLRGLGIPNVAR